MSLAVINLVMIEFSGLIKKVSALRKEIAVSGRWFGSLGAAYRLAACGYQMEVFERRSEPGGRVMSTRSTDFNSVAGQPLPEFITVANFHHFYG